MFRHTFMTFPQAGNRFFIGRAIQSRRVAWHIKSQPCSLQQGYHIKVNTKMLVPAVDRDHAQSWGVVCAFLPQDWPIGLAQGIDALVQTSHKSDLRRAVPVGTTCFGQTAAGDFLFRLAVPISQFSWSILTCHSQPGRQCVPTPLICRASVGSYAPAALFQLPGELGSVVQAFVTICVRFDRFFLVRPRLSRP